MDTIELCQILRGAYSDARESPINDSLTQALCQLSDIRASRASMARHRSDRPFGAGRKSWGQR